MRKWPLIKKADLREVWRLPVPQKIPLVKTEANNRKKGGIRLLFWVRTPSFFKWMQDGWFWKGHSFKEWWDQLFILFPNTRTTKAPNERTGWHIFKEQRKLFYTNLSLNKGRTHWHYLWLCTYNAHMYTPMHTATSFTMTLKKVWHKLMTE